MQRSILIGLAATLLASTALAQSMTPPMVVVAQPQRMQASMGGGFIEFLFGDNGATAIRSAAATARLLRRAAA